MTRYTVTVIYSNTVKLLYHLQCVKIVSCDRFSVLTQLVNPTATCCNRFWCTHTVHNLHYNCKSRKPVGTCPVRNFQVLSAILSKSVYSVRWFNSAVHFSVILLWLYAPFLYEFKYTVNRKKRGTLFLTITTTFLGQFFTLFAANETEINTLQWNYTFSKFALAVSLHYLVKPSVTMKC